MNEKNIGQYLVLMDEIKRRTRVIDAFVQKEASTPYQAVNIECVYLQFRKILELIAFGSLVANEEVYAKTYENISSNWNAELILRDVGRANPDFYPQPILQKASAEPRIKKEWANREEYLTQKEFVKLYKKCGAIMHAGNPTGSQVDYAYYESNIITWRQKIMDLLDAHYIRLVDDPHLYLIQMGNLDERPTYTAFAPQTPLLEDAAND